MDFNHLYQDTKPPASIIPRKLGIISDPPVLVLVYQTKSTRIHHAYSRKSGLTRKRKMPLRKFTDKTDVEKYLFTFLQRQNEYLSSVPKMVLEKLLRVIQEIQKGLATEDAVAVVDKEYAINPEEDLNKISIPELIKRKEIMSESFLKNALQPGDPDFIYDKEVEFDVKAMRVNDWDEDAEDKNDIEKENQEKNVSDGKLGKSQLLEVDESAKSNELIEDYELEDKEIENEISLGKVDSQESISETKLTDAITTNYNFVYNEDKVGDYLDNSAKETENITTIKNSSSLIESNSNKLVEESELSLYDLMQNEQRKLESRIWDIIAPNETHIDKKEELEKIEDENFVSEFDDISNPCSKEFPKINKAKKRVTFKPEDTSHEAEQNNQKYIISEENLSPEEKVDMDDLVMSMNDELTNDGDDSDISLESMDLTKAFGTGELLPEQKQSTKLNNEDTIDVLKKSSKAISPSKENTSALEDETDTEDKNSNNLFIKNKQSNIIPKDFVDAGWSISENEKGCKDSEVDELSEVLEELENDSILEDSHSQSSLTNKRMPKEPELDLSKEYDFKLENFDDDNDEEFWK